MHKTDTKRHETETACQFQFQCFYITLLMARILLHDDHEHGSWHLTAVLPTCTVTALHPTRPRAVTPAKRTSITYLYRYAYKPNKSSCRYAYDPTSLAPIYPASRIRLGRASLPRPLPPQPPEHVAGIVLLPLKPPDPADKSHADMPVEPEPVAGTVLPPESDKIPCRYAYGTRAGTVLLPIRTCPRPRIPHR